MKHLYALFFRWHLWGLILLLTSVANSLSGQVTYSSDSYHSITSSVNHYHEWIVTGGSGTYRVTPVVYLVTTTGTLSCVGTNLPSSSVSVQTNGVTGGPHPGYASSSGGWYIATNTYQIVSAYANRVYIIVWKIEKQSGSSWSLITPVNPSAWHGGWLWTWYVMPPTGVSAAANSNGTATVSFSGTQGATNYLLEETNSGQQWTISQSGNGTKTFTTGVLSNGSRTFRVRARLASGCISSPSSGWSGWSGNSNSVTITNCAITASISGTSPTTCGYNNGSISASVSGANGSVQYNLDGGAWQSSNQFLNNVSAGYHTINVKDALNCTASAGGTVGNGGTPTNPNAPANLIVTDGNCGSTLATWNASSGAISYTLYRNGTPIYTGTNTSYTDYQAPTSSTPYNVVANGNCNLVSSYSNTDYGYQIAAPANCASVSGLISQPATTSVQLSFNTVSGANSYTIYYKTQAAGAYSTATAYGSPYTLNNLQQGTSYDYYIVAQCNCGVASGQSNFATFSTSFPALSISANCGATLSQATAQTTTVQFQTTITGGNNNAKTVVVKFDDALQSPIPLSQVGNTNVFTGSKVLQQVGAGRTFKFYVSQSGSASVVSAACAGVTVSLSPSNKQNTGIDKHVQSIKGDPILMASRTYTHATSDLFSSALTSRVSIGRNYFSTLTDFVGAFGFGWFSLFDFKVDASQSDVWKVTYPDGRASYHGVYNNNITRNVLTGQRDSLIKNANNTFTLLYQNGYKALFRTDGQIEKLIDRNLNEMIFNYTGNYCTQLVLPGGRSFIISWNPTTNRITNITNGLTNAFTNVSYSYNGANELVSVTWTGDGTTSVMNYTYTGTHFIYTIADAKGTIYVTNTYNPDGTVANQLDAYNILTTINYSSGATTLNENGHITSYLQDSYGREIANYDELGFPNQTQYTTNNEINEYEDRNGISYMISRDANGNWTQVTDYVGAKTKQKIGAFNLPIGITNALNDSIVIQRDAKGNAFIYTMPDGISTLTTVFLANGLPKEVIDALQRKTKYGYSIFGDLDTVTTALGSKYIYTRNSIGLPVTLKDPLGKIWAIQYNKFGQVKRIDFPDTYYIEYQIDLNGNITGFRNKQGDWTLYEYDLKDRLKKIFYPNNMGFVELNYDAWDNLLSIKDQYAKTILTRTYNARNEISSEITDFGTQNYTYTPNGMIEDVTDNYNKTYHHVYDLQNELISVSNTQLGTANRQHDIIGRTTQQKDVTQKPTNYQHTWKGVSKIIDALGGENEFITNALGEVIAADDANNHRRYFRRDADGRIVSVKFAGGDSILIDWNAASYPSSITDRNGVVMSILYDAVYNIVGITYSTGLNKQFRYSPNGWVMAAKMGNDSVVVSRNVLGWVMSRIENDKTTLYERNLLGIITKVTYPSGKIVEYILDSKYQVYQVKVNGVAIANYFYTTQGAIDSVRLGNGTTQKRFYNGFGVKTGLVNRLANGTIISKQMVSLDSLMMPKIHADELRITPLATPTQYTNTFDADDAPLSNGTQSFTNSKENQQLASRDNIVYTWQADKFAATLTMPNLSYAFRRNAFGEQIGETLNGVSTSFIIDDELFGMATQIAIYSANNTLQEEYVWGPTGIICRDSASTISFYHSDYYNDIAALTSSTGQISDLYATDEWGDSYNHWGASTQKFVWAGASGIRYLGNGIYENRYRILDGKQHRFVSPDPLGSDWSNTQSVQAFRFAYNNPFANNDPTGLRENMGVITQINETLSQENKTIYNFIWDTYNEYKSEINFLAGGVLGKVGDGLSKSLFVIGGYAAVKEKDVQKLIDGIAPYVISNAATGRIFVNINSARFYDPRAALVQAVIAILVDDTRIITEAVLTNNPSLLDNTVTLGGSKYIGQEMAKPYVKANEIKANIAQQKEDYQKQCVGVTTTVTNYSAPILNNSASAGGGSNSLMQASPMQFFTPPTNPLSSSCNLSLIPFTVISEKK